MSFLLGLFGTAMSAYGQKNSARAQAAEAQRQANLEAQKTQAQVNNMNRQAETDLINASLAERDAEAVMLSGLIDEITMRRNNRKIASSQKAAMIQNGVSGFAAEALIEDTEIAMEQDAMRIRYGSLIQAQQFEQEKLNLIRQSEATTKDIQTVASLGSQSVSNLYQSASNIKKAGNIAALNTIVSGVYNYRSLKNG